MWVAHMGVQHRPTGACVAHEARVLEIKKLRAAAMARKAGYEYEIQKSVAYADAWRVLKN